MRCSCCGREVGEDERYCSYCGQNNEHYVGNKPIEKVEIYPKSGGGAVKQSQPAYGQNSPSPQPVQQGPKPATGITTAAKVFLIIGAIITGLSTLIGLAWCIPMCVYYFNRVRDGERVETGFKVCTLLFVSMIGGILMLCDKDH